MLAVLGAISFTILIYLVISMGIWYSKQKVVEAKESFTLEELMKLHDDLLVMINKRLSEANWLTKRSFIKKLLFNLQYDYFTAFSASIDAIAASTPSIESAAFLIRAKASTRTSSAVA